MLLLLLHALYLGQLHLHGCSSKSAANSNLVATNSSRDLVSMFILCELTSSISPSHVITSRLDWNKFDSSRQSWMWSLDELLPSSPVTCAHLWLLNCSSRRFPLWFCQLPSHISSHLFWRQKTSTIGRMLRSPGSRESFLLYLLPSGEHVIAMVVGMLSNRVKG